MTTARLRIVATAAILAGGAALAACGGSGPSVASRVHQSGSTTTSSTGSTTTTTGSTTTTAPTTTTTTNAATAQRVSYAGLVFGVPTGWPVYDLASDQSRCVRLDAHAVYLGQQGSTARCPAHAFGHTESVQVEPLNARAQTDAALATQAETLNGLRVTVDPHGETSGALTAVFPDQGLVVVVTYANSAALAEQILASFQHA
jgi:hypothetical protein